MAVTSTIEYCENTDVFDVFPDINKYRNTTRIIGWVVHSGDLYRADSCGLVTQLFTDGKELGDAEANSGVVNENDEWYYDSALDAVYYYNDATSPADMMMESGADYTTYLQRMRRKASRMVESQLDSIMAREIMKDREGLYTAYIIRATSLMTVLLILKANDPNNDYLNMFDTEYREIIKGYQDGSIVLPNAVTKDSSKGILREVSVNSASDLRPVELRGHYGGSDYELLKVKIESGEGGVMGTSKYTVYASDADNLKQDNIVDSEIINGRFQGLGVGSLQIRWGGDDVASAITTANDEYEIELHGYYMDTSYPNKMGYVRMTRTCRI